MSKNFERQNGGAFRNGRVVATEARFTGEEPTWENADKWDVKKLHAERDRALRFYNYYLTNGEAKLSLLQWMTTPDGGYSGKDISMVESAPDFAPDNTSGKLCRCILRGMPADDAMIGKIRASIDTCLNDVRTGRFDRKNPTAKPATATPQISMAERIRAKVSRTVLQDLEVELDQWLVTASGNDAPDMHKLLDKHDCPPQGIYIIEAWIDKKLNEFNDVLKGEDAQLVEAYKLYPTKQVKEWVAMLTSMKCGLTTYVAAKKALRKPRAKRTKPAEKQVTRVKYLTASKEYNVTSISPVLIVGAKHVWLFNTKYRLLQYYQADGPAGLSVKGTSIKGWNTTASYRIALRKPDQVLPAIVSKTYLQIQREIDKLTTKAGKPNGRLNEETVILRAMNN